MEVKLWFKKLGIVYFERERERKREREKEKEREIREKY